MYLYEQRKQNIFVSKVRQTQSIDPQCSKYLLNRNCHIPIDVSIISVVVTLVVRSSKVYLLDYKSNCETISNQYIPSLWTDVDTIIVVLSSKITDESVIISANYAILLLNCRKCFYYRFNVSDW